jgi:hypothetical protein
MALSKAGLIQVGNAAAEDRMIVFDGNAVDYRLGIDDSTDIFEIGIGSTHATTPVINIDSSGNMVVNEGSANTDFRVESNGDTHALFVDGSEDTVGIGNSSPSGKLDITNSAATDSLVIRSTAAAVNDNAVACKINIDDTSNTDNFYALAYYGGGSHRFSVTGSGLTTIDTLSANSDVQTGGAKQLTASSDMRLKNDKGLLTDGTTKIKQLKPRYFKWKEDVEKNGEDNTPQQLGFFSQEVNPIIPEAAGKVALKDKDGNAILDSEGNQDYNWGLNTRAIVATLVKSVQELEARIKTLEDA